MDLLNKSTILYINQVRQENFEKLIGKGFSEAFSWRKLFKRIIFVCYSSTDRYLYKKYYGNYYLIGIPFDLTSSTIKSILNIGKNYLNLFFFLNQLMKKTPVNIIRLENLLLSGLPVYIISKIKKIPYIVWLGGYERKSLYLKYGENFVTWLLSKLIVLLEKTILKNANFVFPVTNELLELAQKRNVKNKFLSPNFVDLSEFKEILPKNNNDSNERIKLLYVGRFEEEKGIKTLLKAMKILSNEKVKYELSMIGNGSLMGWIENFIDKNDLRHIILPGYFDHKEMPLFYNRADIFILPSYTEGSPASLIEAMSCGTASICTSVGECKKIIQNGVNGILVSAGDSNQLSKAIEQLINNKELRKNFGENSRISILKYTRNYSKIHKYIYEQLLNLYNI